MSDQEYTLYKLTYTHSGSPPEEFSINHGLWRLCQEKPHDLIQYDAGGQAGIEDAVWRSYAPSMQMH